MSFSQPFIERPIGTTLLAIGLFLVGAVAYLSLPVASLPSVERQFRRARATLPRSSRAPPTSENRRSAHRLPPPLRAERPLSRP